VGVEGFEAMTGAWGEAFSTQESSVVATSFPDEHHLIAEIRQRAVGARSGVPVEMTNFYLLEVRTGAPCASTSIPTTDRR
jgi:hypothetical protein